MAAQTWDSIYRMLLATLVNAQPPFAGNLGDARFQELIPQATGYAEGRIYRDVIFLAQRQAVTTLTTTIASRTVALGSIGLLVPEGFALITPAGTSTPALGTRVPFRMATLDVIDELWPVEAAVLPPNILDWNPRYWAMRDDHTIVYCPTADAVYTVELTGLFQPVPISATNQSTYLSTTYPELLEIACMIFLAGALQHNFGAMSDNPQSALSWEGQYQALIPGVRNEERRRRGLDPDAPMPKAAP